MTTITDPRAPAPCPFQDREIFVITSGGHRGTIVRVDGRASFWSPAWRYNNDPAEPLVPASWQIVLDAWFPDRGDNGEWLYFIRESADVIRQYVRPFTRSWYDVAIERGAVEDDGMIPGDEFARVGIALLNGCPGCGATVGPHTSFQVAPDNPFAWCRSCAGLDD